MKKLLLSCIATLLLITGMPSYAVICEENKVITESFVEETNLENIEIEVLNANIPTLSPKVIEELNKLAKSTADASFASGFINGIQSVISVGTTIGSIFTTYNAINIFLKSIGVVESTEEIQRRVVGKIDDMQTTINQMNEKLNDIVNLLEANFAQVGLDFDDVKVRLDKQNIGAFITDYETPMANRLSNFRNTLESKFDTWCLTKKTDLTLPISYVKTKTDLITSDNLDDVISEANDNKNKYVNVKLDTDLLDTVFAEPIQGVARNEFGVLTKDNEHQTYEDYIIANMKNYYLNAGDEINEWKKEYAKENANDSAIVDDFANAFYQALTNVFYMEICEEGKGTTSQYINDVCNEFRNYCNRLNDTDASPYMNQLDILPKIYLFQKETKDIVAELKTYYIANLTKYANFYLGAIASCKISNYNEYVELYNNTIEKMADCFDNFLVKDNEGNIIDNYCYVTGTQIEFEKCTLSQNVKVYHEQYTNHMFGINYEVYNGYSATPFTLNESNNNIVSNQDMLKISALYKYLGAKDSDGNNQSLNKYLQMNMFGEERIAFQNLRTIVTNYKGTQTFNLSEKINMRVGIGGIGRSTYFPIGMWEKKINDNSSSDISDDGFVVHDSAVADTFDLNNLSLTTNSKLISRALFAKHSSAWIKDEMCFFLSRDPAYDISDNKTKTVDGHDFYTAELDTNDLEYVIRKYTGTFSENTVERLNDYNNLTEASSLRINNTNDYYEKNDVDESYIMYFDESTYLTEDEDLNKEIKKGFVDFANSVSTINGMETYNKHIVDTIKNIEEFANGSYEVKLSDNEINKIVDKINASANKNKEVPTVEGKKLSDALKLPTKEDNCKVVISLIYLPVFRIDRNDNLYHYSVYDTFVLRPYLVWNNGNSYTEISDSIIKDLDLSFSVKIPALNKEDGANRAIINHYDSKYNLYQPIEEIDGRIVGDYIEFKTSSFSPFSIKSYYHKDPNPQYVPVKTGIN